MAVNNTKNISNIKIANDSAILQKKFDSLMESIGYFEDNPTICVANSGGADSTALLLLTKNWTDKNNGKLVSLTINHGLRKEAEKEAKQVVKWCEYHNIESHIIKWQHGKVLSSIQEQARSARYELLTKWCKNNSILHLLTAHHNNDQIETMIFRLLRKSGIEGLSAIPYQRVENNVRILRPLLSVKKSELIDFLKNNSQEWIEDPSNQDDNYSRVLIRKSLNDYNQVNNSEEHIIKSANNIITSFSIFRNILENKVASYLTNIVKIYPSGYSTITVEDFLRLEKNIAIKILTAISQTVSGSYYPTRSYKIENIYSELLNELIKEKNKVRKSLSGLIFEVIKDEIFIYREVEYIEKPVKIPNNTLIFWDNRFLITLTDSNSLHKTPKIPELIIRSLSNDGLKYIENNNRYSLKKTIPARILCTFPSIWIINKETSLEELVATPHIDYTNRSDIMAEVNINIQFYPTKPLAGNGFFVMNNDYIV
ncbi:MAG: tRNA lysidine(34) synthetase TilS [Rickettsiales bacterium]